MAYNFILHGSSSLPVVKQFLDEIVPQLIARGFTVNYDPDKLDKLCVGAGAEIKVFDGRELVFSNDGYLISFEDMAGLAKILEYKQVELQLNALLPRMAAVGWQLKCPGANPYQMLMSDTCQKLVLTRADGTEQEISPSFDGLKQLREELNRTEATHWIQLHWLELEAAGYEIKFGPDVIILTRSDKELHCSYTLKRVKDLTKTALHKGEPLDSTYIA